MVGVKSMAGLIIIRRKIALVPLLPIAAVFKVFGVGLVQGHVVMGLHLMLASDS